MSKVKARARASVRLIINLPAIGPGATRVWNHPLLRLEDSMLVFTSPPTENPFFVSTLLYLILLCSTLCIIYTQLRVEPIYSSVEWSVVLDGRGRNSQSVDVYTR